MIRFERQRAVNAIIQSTVFDGVKQEDAMELVQCASLRCYDPGDLLIKQGTKGEAMFVLILGEVVIYLEEGNNEVRELTRRYRGGFVGEFALLSSAPRTASVVAAVSTTVSLARV